MLFITSYAPPASKPLKAIATLKSFVIIHSIIATVTPIKMFWIGIKLFDINFDFFANMPNIHVKITVTHMNINIININQNIMQGFFNMVLIADMEGANVTLAEAREVMVKLGEEIGVEIRLQSEEIFTAMHRI